MLKRLTICVALALAVFIFCSARMAHGQAASMHGTVILLNGSPVPQATVIIEGAKGGQAATTNQSGQYTMAGVAPGSYTVRISSPGYDDFVVQITLKPDFDQEIDAVLMARPAEPAPTPAAAPAAPSEAPAGQEPAPGPAQTPTKAAAPGTVTAQELNVRVQKGRSAVYGNVTDPTGALVPGGTATLQGATGAPQTATVNERGQYVLNGLIPGPYKLTINATGFAPFQTDITLAADQGIEIDAPLVPPSEKTTVNVEANSAAEIQTETAHIEGTITEKEVLKTGLNGRNFTQLIALAPGVSNQTQQDEALVGVKGSVKYSVNGGRVEYNNFDVDGSDVLNAGLNGAESTLMVYPSLDAIQEVKVLTSNYGAMYGRSASGTVLVTTKSGTSNLHGGLYDFVRNEVFNARNYFDETNKAPLYRRQDFGGTIGGPVFFRSANKKDKAYFFWSEEFRLEKTPQEFNQAVPTLAERGVNVNCAFNTVWNQSGPGTCGDFSDVCPFVGASSAPIDRRLYPDCPVGTILGGDQIGTFTSNQVPTNPTSAMLLASGIIPFPTSATGCNSSLAGTVNPNTNVANVPCYATVVSPSTYWREELGRFDYNFTQNVRLTFRYIHDSWNTTVLTPQWGYVVNSFPTVENKFVGPGTSLVLKLTNTLSPTLLNELTASYVNSHITLADENGPGANLQPLPACQTPASTGCIGYIFNNGFGGKPPGVVIGGTNAAYGGIGFTVDPSYPPWDHTNPTYGLSDNLSKSLGGGKHTLQVGIQVIDAQRSETNGAIGAATGDLQGLLSFNNQNNLYTTGNAFADFIGGSFSGDLGEGLPIKSYQQDSAQLKYYNDYWITEPYVQDDWHVSRRLTVNLGVRLSFLGNFHEKNLNAWNWVPSAYSSSVASTVQIAAYPASGGVLPSGYLADLKGNPFPFDPNNPQSSLMPYATNPVTNGLVQCGKNGVPASCMSSHLFNPAPRIGFAWDPKGDGKTSVRAGYGMFYEHGTAKEANTGSLEGSSPLVLSMTNPFPFSYGGIGIGGPNDDTQVAYPLDVTSIPTKTTWPYVQQWSLSVQQQLPANTIATVAYVGSKGTHLAAELQKNQLPTPPVGPDVGIFPTGNPYGPGQPILTSDCSVQGFGGFLVNGQIPVPVGSPAYTNMVAACYGSDNPVTGAANTAVPNPNTLRPYFGFQRILALENIADSQYHGLQITMRRTHGPLTLGLSYTYSHSFDDSSDRSDASFVNSSNIKASWASSNFDQRHLFNFNYIYDLPKLASAFEHMVTYRKQEGSDGKLVAPSGFTHAAFDGWQVSGITVFQSGTPFSVINGGSNIGISVLDNAGVANGAGAGSYPDIVASPRSALPGGVNRLSSQSIGPLLYNPAAFAAPQGLTFGGAGRNFLDNPHRINFDMSLFKNFKIKEESNVEFRFEAFNVFNHTQFRIFNPNIGNAANNTISCYGGGIGGPYTAAGGLTYLPGQANSLPEQVDCIDGSSFLRPIDAHRPRTIQLGLKYSF